MANRQQAALLQLWQRAAAQSDPLVIGTVDEASARRLRMALYNALRSAKKSGSAADNAFLESISHLSLVVSGPAVSIQPQQIPDWKDAVTSTITPDPAPASPDEIAALISAQQALAKLQSEFPPQRNPYYTSDD